MKYVMPFCSNGCGKRCSTMKRKYCSVKCHHEHDFKRRVVLLESGLYPPSSNPVFIWRYLLWKHGERCVRCGWAERNPTTGRVPLEVEHIDGNWKNTTLQNLSLLCPNCHSLTATFRGLNRGRGRAERWGGRSNPLRQSLKKHSRLRPQEAPFPLPRSLVDLVEAMEPSPDTPTWLSG